MQDGIIKVCAVIRPDMRSAPIQEEQKLFLCQGLLNRGCISLFLRQLIARSLRCDDGQANRRRIRSVLAPRAGMDADFASIVARRRRQFDRRQRRRVPPFLPLHAADVPNRLAGFWLEIGVAAHGQQFVSDGARCFPVFECGFDALAVVRSGDGAMGRVDLLAERRDECGVHRGRSAGAIDVRGRVYDEEEFGA